MGVSDGICAVLSAIIGAAQFLLLMQITIRVTGIKSGSVLPFLIIKLALYGVCITLLLLFLQDYALYAGLGYAVGFFIAIPAALPSCFKKDDK